MADNPFGTPHPSAGSPFGGPAPTPTTGPNGEATAAVGGQLGGPGAYDQLDKEPPPDINDPGLTSELLTVAEGDAFASPPPPPDKQWRAKLKHEGIKQDGSSEVLPWIGAWQKDKNGAKVGMYARTVMSVTIQDPAGKFDGLHLSIPFFFMDTKKNRDKVSKIETVLGVLRRPDGQPWIQKGEQLPHKQLIERFIQALQSEPEVLVDSAWEVTCDVCAKLAKAKGDFAKPVTGMTKFQPSRTVRGEYDPDYLCQIDRGHGYSRARAMAVKFSALPK